MTEKRVPCILHWSVYLACGLGLYSVLQYCLAYLAYQKSLSSGRAIFSPNQIALLTDPVMIGGVILVLVCSILLLYYSRVAAILLLAQSLLSLSSIPITLAHFEAPTTPTSTAALVRQGIAVLLYAASLSAAVCYHRRDKPQPGFGASTPASGPHTAPAGARIASAAYALSSASVPRLLAPPFIRKFEWLYVIAALTSGAITFFTEMTGEGKELAALTGVVCIVLALGTILLSFWHYRWLSKFLFMLAAIDLLVLIVQTVCAVLYARSQVLMHRTPEINETLLRADYPWLHGFVLAAALIYLLIAMAGLVLLLLPNATAPRERKPKPGERPASFQDWKKL